ncbi:DNA damage-inducible protein F [Halomonadaceae bacterium LMG 33818]|uniref:MATE family efflux transporter n=1 Tax=Cernens ardua TaxID=3402176 RepID=UPI003EDC96CF
MSNAMPEHAITSPPPHVPMRKVWHLAWPIILSNISVPLLGLIGTAAVGHLSNARYLGAVTLGTTLFDLLFWAFGFLRMGTTGLTSQAFGQESDDRLRRILMQSLATACSLGILLIALSPLIIPWAIHLIGGSPSVQALATQFAHIRIFSAPAVLANYVILGWFLGQQHSRTTLLLVLVSNSINILLLLLFVLWMGLHSNGVAWASLVSDYFTLLVGIALIWRRSGQLSGKFATTMLKHIDDYLALFNVNKYLFIRTLCLLFVNTFFTSRGAVSGTTLLAANAVLMEFLMLTSYALDGFAQSAEAMTGSAIGAKRFDLFGASVRACARLSFWTALTASVLLAVFGSWLIELLTSLKSVQDAAQTYLPWMIIMPLIAVWAYLMDGVFVGATATKPMRDTLLLSLFVFLPTWYFTRSWGNNGLWFSFMMFTLVRSASLSGIYLKWRKGRWSSTPVRES